MAVKKTITEIRDAFAVDGYVLESQVYEQCMAQLDVSCPRGHRYRTSWNNFQQGYRCSDCAGIVTRDPWKSTLELATKAGFVGVEAVAKNSKLKDTRVVCGVGHVTLVSRDTLRALRGCAECNRFRRKSLGDIQEDVDAIREAGLEVLDFAPVSKSKLRKAFTIRCPKSHIFAAWRSDIKRRGARCPKCISKSRPELILRGLLSELKLEHRCNTRRVIPPLELDIFVPSLRLAIEFNGCWWHRDTRVGPNYHKDKMDRCREAGVNLVSIHEHTWMHHRQEWLDYLRLRLGAGSLQDMVSAGTTLGLVRDGRICRDLGLIENEGKEEFTPAKYHLALTKEKWVPYTGQRRSVTIHDSGWTDFVMPKINKEKMHES